MELRYSILPYPNGCFLSGDFPASFVPIMVMTELAASEMLFTASITMAMEFVANPTTALNPAKNALAMIPIILVLIITLSREFCSFMVFSFYSFLVIPRFSPFFITSSREVLYSPVLHNLYSTGKQASVTYSSGLCVCDGLT